MSDQGGGSVATVKRRDDPENADHRGERRFDWREMAPRWLLVSAVAFLLASTGYLWGKNASLYDSRMELLEKYQSDARWELLTKLSEEQVKQGIRLNHNEAQLQQLTKAADDIAEMRRDVRDLKRMAESGGK
jgi:hypothetical protein